MAEVGIHQLLILFIFVNCLLKDIHCSCESGKFGWKCKFDCSCKDSAVCDPTNGHCPVGCSEDRYGHSCLLDNRFRYDEHGFNYSGSVSITKSKEPCMSWNSQTIRMVLDVRKDNFVDGHIPGAVCRYPRGKINFNQKDVPMCFYGTLQAEECDIPRGECVDGRFGDSCLYECHCKDVDEACDKTTGKCTSGCHPGWLGDRCQTKCPDGKFGDSCLETCGNCQNGNCDFESGKCLEGCTSGYYGDLCKTECLPKFYGENCARKCGQCLEVKGQGFCDHLTGSCNEGCVDGYIGSTCHDACEDFFYGHLCNQTCGNCLNGAPCLNTDGSCPDGCSPGWTGHLCKEECPDGKFGGGCLETCGHCKNQSCDFVSGKCLEGCTFGYYGDLCKTECLPKFYGEHCSSKCGRCLEVKGQGFCDHVTGLCNEGCVDGYIGSTCHDECANGSWGFNCSSVCGQCKGGLPCHKQMGACLNGCAEGFEGEICVQAIHPQSAGLSAGAAVGIATVFIVIILVAVILFVVIRRRRSFKTLEINANTEKSRNKFNEGEKSRETDLLINSENGLEDANIDTEPIYVNVNKKQSNPIFLQDLYDYIRDKKKNDCEGFKKEFSELPHGLHALCEEARKPENRPKNRYGNITAYDHSRVHLVPIDGEVGSDYINANYIDGYKRPSAYIACQGCNKVMIRDFWRMVWQKKICKILMLTNLIEAGKKKCEQYWPESGVSRYGSMTVEIIKTDIYTDFTIRTFKLEQIDSNSKTDSSRVVRQFHYTTWCDHGALTYPTPLLTFKRKVDLYNPESTAPIIVHCSAGIGRSGTYIALDYLLQQAKEEKLVDVLRCAQLMRGNRINMIQTWEQYVFVYEALLEAVKAGNTTMPVEEFQKAYESLCTLSPESQTTGLDREFKVLQQITHPIDNDEFKAALTSENINKNRVKNVLPANKCRPHLYTMVEGSNDYVNAIFLPGYLHKDTYIVTQMPLPNTVADFWRLLYDYNSTTVIMLNDFDRNDKTCALYWPEEHGYTVEYDPLSIELLSSTEVDPNVSVRIFRLSNPSKGEERAVKQFQLKSWPDYQKVPNSTGALLHLYKMMKEWVQQNKRGPITVHCMNGASKSGVFCAVSTMLDRIQKDEEVDLFQTVMTIRTNRPQFIEDIEQYQFCYQMALEYLESQY